MPDHEHAQFPAPRALAAFARGRAAQRLSGGMGTSWRAGDIVLKPSPGSAQARCLAETQAGLREVSGCRFQRPVPAPLGGWEIDGWTAWHWIEGETVPTKAREIVLAARAYHNLIAELPCDSSLLVGDDPWARADRVAWGEMPLNYSADYNAMLRPLLASPLPNQPSQRVHADLTGNVVFAPGLAPGIIDPTLYWRPPAFAEAVVLVDQSWFSKTLDLGPFHDTPALASMLRRAAARRIAEQPEQVAAHGKNASEARTVAHQIAEWTNAALDRLGAEYSN